MKGGKHSEKFEEIEKAVANITNLNYYDLSKETRMKSDASHSGLGAALKQKTEEVDWIPILIASRYLKSQEENTPEVNWSCWQSFGRLIELNITS